MSYSGSTSSIKRGYWFGEVNNKATVIIITVILVAVKQLNLQRSGTACGSCKEGYTLPFDSIECVSVEKCTTGHCDNFISNIL